MSLNVLQNWTVAATPGAPLAVVARGAAARQLALRLLERDGDTLKALQGVVSRDRPGMETEAQEQFIVVLGAAESLPWADGAIYLGAGAGGLLWPVLAAPPVPPGLLAKAVLRAHPSLPTPLALVPKWGLIVPLGNAGAIERPLLRQFAGLPEEPAAAQLPENSKEVQP